jgi:Amt family ammonium transporter
MIDKGVTTFMVLATSLVMLMTPGLAFFYGGSGNKKNILNIMMQSFVSLGLTSVLWFSFGYSLCFSETLANGTDLWGEHEPNNIPLVAIGTTLLWFGWYGFNAGSELDMNDITVAAFINTDISDWFAATTWLLIEWNSGKKKPSFIGLMTGAVAGLATITPASGYVTAGSAAIIGIISGVVCFQAVQFKNRMKWDDALDVWGVHGVGVVFGTILLGFFATNTINPGTINGLIYGGGFELIIKELVAVLTAIIWASSFTWGMLHVIDKFVPVKVTDAVQKGGLDFHSHGEVARVI